MGGSYINNKYLIEFLKKNNVKKIVLSSGTRNIPFISMVENDSFFECFSVVDERNAAFFGMGLSQESREIVAIACTSGTAVSNYVSGVTEAFYSRVPLVVITFDRSTYVLNQLETQKIDQMSIFDTITKSNICLPVIKDEEDIWYCQRILNEAFIQLNYNGFGPIHINVPFIGSTNELWDDSKNSYISNSIKYIDMVSPFDDFSEIYNRLMNKKVLILIGQDINMSNDLKNRLVSFVYSHKIPVITDNLSNFKSKNNINAERLFKALDSITFENIMPDIIITYGLNFQERVKDLFKSKARQFEHWMICEDTTIRDCFKSLTLIFNMKLDYYLNKMEGCSFKNDINYLNKLISINEKLYIPELKFSNFSVIKEFSKIIPNNSLLHLSILNSTRLMQFFDLNGSIKVHSNVNTFGIDGCLPTFLGQAFCFDGLAFIIIGDLSFFYGMNALSIRHINNNVRVLLINNHGGAEFHIPPSSREIKGIDNFIGAGHHFSSKGWVESLGFKYLSSNNENDLKEKFKPFISNSDSPIILEVFTDINIDGDVTLNTYRDLEKQLKDILK